MPGILKSKAQYDRATGITKTARQYQEELLVIIKKVIEMQKDFIKQIKLIEIQIVCNFKKYVESRLKILYYERYFKYKYKSEGLFICKIVEEEKRIQRIINRQGIVTNQINIIGRSVKKTV